MNAELTGLIDRLTRAGRITAEDVLALRAQVYGANKITPDELEAMAALDAVATARPREWVDFLAEAMTDYVVHDQDPPDYVDQAKADWLVRTLSRAAPQAAQSAMEVLVHVLEAASQVPESLTAFALNSAKAAAIGKGQVGAADVAVLRRLVFASAGDGYLSVSRAEADALFEINQACRGAANDPAWADFFAKAILDCLTAGNPFRTESREEALRDEAWLESRETIGQFAASMFKRPDVSGAFHEYVHPLADEAAEWAKPEAEMEAAAAAAAPISDDEAKWLVSHLGQGELSQAEQRLIGLLKTQVSDVSGLLQPLFDAAPAASAEAPSSATPVFGHRKSIPA